MEKKWHTGPKWRGVAGVASQQCYEQEEGELAVATTVHCRYQCVCGKLRPRWLETNYGGVK